MRKNSGMQVTLFMVSFLMKFIFEMCESKHICCSYATNRNKKLIIKPHTEKKGI